MAKMVCTKKKKKNSNCRFRSPGEIAFRLNDRKKKIIKESQILKTDAELLLLLLVVGILL
jgi:hypothetical protein